MRVLFLNFILFFSPSLWAQDCIGMDQNPVAFPQLATSGRALGFGNAYIGKVDDSAAPFYNAAGLGTVRPTNFHITDIHFENSQDYLTMQKGTTSETLQGFLGKVTIEGTRVILLENEGDIAYSRFNVLPNYTMRYFSAGYLVSQQSRMTILGPDAPNYEYNYRFDHGPYAAANISLWGGVLKVGLMGIYLIRKELYGCAPKENTVFITDESFNKGNGLFGDLGVRVTLPTDWIPSFSFVSHNFTRAVWSSNVTDTPASRYENTLDAGISITPQIGKMSRLYIELDYNDFMRRYPQVNDRRRILFGAEYDWARRYFIRVGMVDGYFSAGFGFKSKHFNFAFSSYGAELDPTDWHVRQERRYLIAFDFGI